MVLHTRVVSGSGGGPDKTILNSPRFLRELGYDCACLYLRPPGDMGFQALRDRAQAWKAPLEEIDDRGAWDIGIVRRSLEVCRRLNVAVWHGHDYKSNLLGVLLRKWYPMRLVTTAHGWVHHTRSTRLYYKADRWSMKRYERVVCVSPDLLEECRAFGVRDERSLLIENAIDTQQFRRRRSTEEAKRALGLPADVPLIGAVGRLSAEKGFDRLLTSVSELHKRGVRANLAIIGDGDQRGYLESLIAKIELTNHVRLVGFHPNPTDWYEAMDVFSLSSLREGLPNVVLEAMALETPVVVTRVAGVPRLVEHDVSGLIVPIDDTNALTTALSRLLKDDGLRRRLAAAARRVIEIRYSFSMRMEKIAAVYRELGVPPGQAPVPGDAIASGAP